ncbi:MAG: branched-chain amino acid ABC transporter permease [Pseudorhodoplanes sp.]
MQIVENFLQLLIVSLTIGCLYGLMCMGLSMIFGVMRIVNFAQGEFLMLGMYATFYLALLLTAPGIFGPWTPFLATILAAPFLFIAAIACYAAFLGSLTERRGMGEDVKHSAQLIITLGLSLVLQNGALVVFGTLPQSAKTPLSTEAWIVSLFGGDVMLFANQARVIAALIAILIAIGIVLVMSRTALGRSVRAAADDPDAARYSGVNIGFVYKITFGLGAAMTAIAGGLMASYFPFQPYVGGEFIIIMYAGVVLGGMGSVLGAFWGGLIIGVIQQMSTLVLPQQLQNATIFIVFLLILLFRPNGLLGRSTERA